MTSALPLPIPANGPRRVQPPLRPDFLARLYCQRGDRSVPAGTRHLQRVRFNVVVEVPRLSGPIDDDVDRILSYDRVTEAIGVELHAERLNLLETLAARVADRILLEPQAQRVFVRIEKLDRGPFALGVEIVRARDGQTPSGQAHIPVPHPRVVFLSNAAIASPLLGAG